MSKKQDIQFKLDQSRNRYFSESFKRSKVEEIRMNKLKIREVCDLYNVSRTSVYKWIYLYSDIEKGTNTVVQMESESSKTSYYKSKLAELERLYGQKQIEIDYLNKGFELASEEMGYDVKKKYVTPPLSGSGSTAKNTAIK